jgi:isoleucyl-tRNA synthetase
VTVALDTVLDEPLIREGIAREVVSVLQTARKDAGLEVQDRIAVTWSCSDPNTVAALREHADVISREVLAVEFREGVGTTTLEVNKVPVGYTISKPPK